MSVKLRLRRGGRKGRPFYSIVAADARARRDGRFIEKIGTYNPIADPAHISIEHDKAIKWLKNGAQMSDTVRSLFRYEGITLKYALIKQGKDEATIESIFGKWRAEKDAKIEAKKEGLASKNAESKTSQLAAETARKEARAAAIAAKNTPEPVEEEAPAAAEEGEAEVEAPEAAASTEETPAE